MWSQSVGVAQWVRPAISMLRTSFSGGLARNGSMISCCFFERSCYVLTFYVGFFSDFSYVTLVVSFFKNQIVFGWVCLTTFLCFIISFLDFIIVFKE